MLVVVGIPQSVVNHQVKSLLVSQTVTLTCTRKDIGHLAHVLHAACDHDLAFTKQNGPGTQDDGHHPAAADLVDGIEVLNGKTSLKSLNQKAVAYANEHDLAIGAGSDAHVAEAIGAAYLEMPDFGSPDEFLDSMRQGRAVGHYYDPPRRWRPRIVPSTAD